MTGTAGAPASAGSRRVIGVEGTNASGSSASSRLTSCGAAEPLTCDQTTSRAGGQGARSSSWSSGELQKWT